jgi:hypothetical protein
MRNVTDPGTSNLSARGWFRSMLPRVLCEWRNRSGLTAARIGPPRNRGKSYLGREAVRPGPASTPREPTRPPRSRRDFGRGCHLAGVAA